LREKQWLRVFENIMLRKIFGPKRDEATGEWRRLHNEELYDLYLPNNLGCRLPQHYGEVEELFLPDIECTWG